MKKSLLTLAVSMCALSMTAAETPQTFTIDGKDYSYNLITSKQVGPGVVYNRIRIADFPLNINYMTVDLTNPTTVSKPNRQTRKPVRQRNLLMPTPVCRKPERSQSALKTATSGVSQVKVSTLSSPLAHRSTHVCATVRLSTRPTATMTNGTAVLHAQV